jgi:3-oxoacyl-[acyl-carrier protein] reductase
MGGTAMKVKADVTKQSEVHSMFQTVLKQFGRIDILVNNAGTMGQPKFLEISEADWDRVLAVNLKGMFNCCQAVIPIFLKQSGGKIINMSSLWEMGASGVHRVRRVIGLTMALSMESERNIHVNATAPARED